MESMESFSSRQVAGLGLKVRPPMCLNLKDAHAKALAHPFRMLLPTKCDNTGDVHQVEVDRKLSNPERAH